MGIYKRKQGSKKKRKKELDQESDQEKKKKLSFFLDYFLGRVLVFFFFIVFLFSFIPTSERKIDVLISPKKNLRLRKNEKCNF